MPSPAKRVAAEPMSLDDRDLLAISEEKKAMVLTFGAGGLLCAGNFLLFYHHIIRLEFST